MNDCLVTWPELTPGILVRRYKRFLADIELADGGVLTAHCPNSGRMLQCSEPGRKVLLSHSSNPSRKHAFTWEIIEMPTSPVVVNTLRANQAAGRALRSGMITALAGYEEVRSEVVTGKGTRIDFVLEHRTRPACMIEVKSCTYVEHGIAMFPDAVSERGRKHLMELQANRAQAGRAVLLLLVQRMDARVFKPADHIDPAWGAELRRADSAGVEILAFTTSITEKGMALAGQIPVRL